MPCGVRAGLAALAFLAVAAAPAAGQVGIADPVQQSQAIDQQLSQYRRHYAEVSANEVDLLAQLDVARHAKDAADLELARLDSSVQEAVSAVAAAQQARDAAQTAAADASSQLQAARAEAAAAHEGLRRQAIDAYVGQGRFGVLSATLQPTSQEDALTASYYAELAGGAQASRLATAQATREAATAAESVAAVAAARAASTQTELAQKQTAVQQARDAQAAAQQHATDQVAQEEQLLADLQQQQATYSVQITELQAESQQIATLLRQRAAAAAAVATSAVVKTPLSTKPTGPPRVPVATTAKPAPATPAQPVATTAKPVTTAVPAPAPAPAPTTGQPAVTSYPQDYSTGKPPVSAALTYPLPGAPIVSTFGMRTDPVLNVSLMHEGIDIWAPEGTPIHAAGGGLVIWAGDRHGYGNAVFIDHGNAVVSVYAHQSKVAVSVGQHVGVGDVIGYVGHTGLAAGPHLHFEVRVNGTAYNPLNFVSPR